MKFFDVIIRILLFLLLIFMAEPVWGMLAKSQTDGQTIEERIIELIEDHNDAPTAHVGPDRSVTVHRENETLDHVPGSVLADKSTFKELVHKPSFESLSGWSQLGSINLVDTPFVQIYIEDGAVQKSELYTAMLAPANYFNSGYNMMFQIGFIWSGSSNDLEFWLGLGLDGVSAVEGMGFIYDGSNLLPVVGYGGNQYQGAPIGVDINEFNIVRAQFNAEAESVDFYVNGELVESITVPAGSWASDAGPRMGAQITSTNDGGLLITDLTYARALVNA